MRFRLLLLLLFAYSSSTYSQDEKAIGGTTTDGLEENYRIKDNNQYTFVVNYSSSEESSETQVAGLIAHAIAVYIDKSYQVGENKLIFAYEPVKMMEELNSLANQGLSIFQIQHRFSSFSSEVQSKLNSLDELSWTKAEYELLGDTPEEQKETLTYLLSSEIFNLKNTCKSEISVFLNEIESLEIPEEWTSKLSEETNSTMAYASEDFMEPIEFTFDQPLSTTELDSEPILSKNIMKDFEKGKKKKRNGKDQFSQDVLALLQQNSEQLISIKRDILDFRKENAERDQKIEKENTQQIVTLQKQIDELKNYIYADNKKPKNLHVYENTLDEVLVIYFNKNSKDLSEKYKLELNTILSTLLKNPTFKIMITGFADKSGDPDYNAYLSKERAKEVRNYLYIKGIPKKRMLTNYLGDISSASENANDRRVEIEFISEIGQMELSAN